MERKTDINLINLTINEVLANNNAIKIRWSSDIGFGEYDIVINKDGSLTGFSETMDINDDKEFLKKLLSIIVDKIDIKC